MIWPPLQHVAQAVIGHVLNSLPEAMLIALFAWMMLRLLPRQNSGTRFAVWFVALIAVAGLPVLGPAAATHPFAAARAMRPMISMPAAWGVVLFLCWVMAAGVALLRLAIGVWRLRELRRSCVALDAADLNPAIQKSFTQFNASRSVDLATSDSVSVPAVLGLFKPMIVIPTWALRELPPEELKIILLHEFAHLCRWDDWSNLVQKIVRAVLLVHPAIWWIERRLTLEREMACDDAVLAETANPRGYAKCLVSLLEKRLAGRALAMAQAVVHRANETSLRLAQILDAGRPKTKLVWKPALGFVGAFSVVCLVVGPHTRQLVSFEQRSPAIHAGAVQTASLLRAQIPPAVIPASLHVNSLSVNKTPRPLRAKGWERRRVASRGLGGDLNPGAEVRPARGTGVAVDDGAATGFGAVLLIRTSQRLGPNSWVWSVSVWRVTLVNATQPASETGTGFVAHKT